MKDSFLCGSCRRAMCRECTAIATEYAELLDSYKARNWKEQQLREQAQQEAARAVKRADEYERLMKLGQHALLLAWMDSMTPTQLREAVERTQQ